MDRLRVKFSDAYSTDVYTFTPRRKNAATITMHEVLFKRYQNVTTTSEKNRLVFFLGICLIHEISHLLFRWRGILYTPPKFCEAGVYLEEIICGRKHRLFVRKGIHKRMKQLDAGMPVEQIVLSFDNMMAIKDEGIDRIVNANSNYSITLPIDTSTYKRKKGVYVLGRIVDE